MSADGYLPQLVFIKPPLECGADAMSEAGINDCMDTHTFTCMVIESYLSKT